MILRTFLPAACCLALTAAFPAAAQVNITTWQANLKHTGANLNESTLTPALVKSSGFGLLFTSPPMDGQINAQPLCVSNLNIGGANRNVIYTATQRGWIYATDATTAGDFIWSRSLIPAGAVYVPQSEVNSGDITDALSLTATPVIDLASQTIYVLVKYKVTANGTYQQRLHALDLKTGADKLGGPVLVNPTFAGSSNWNGTESANGVIPFNPLRSHARCALALHNGIVYLSYASHSDTDPYHGEIIGYDATTLQLVKTFISSPNGQKNGFWAGGASPAVDDSGNMYAATGNGPWDQTASPYTADTNWGMTILKLPTTGPFTVSFSNPLNWFTPNDWRVINNADADLGSSGILILPDQAGPHPHLLLGGGKGGQLFVLDRDAMGGIDTPNNSVQEINDVKGLFVTPAYFNGYIYYAPGGGPLTQRAVGYNPIDGSYLSTNENPATRKSTFIYNGGHGAHAFVSANGNQNGLVWCLELGTPAKLHAYDAADISGPPIYNGAATTGQGNFTGRKFCIPIVANGKIYFTGDIGNSSRLFVFGPPPPAAGTPTAPSGVTATAISSSQVRIDWTDASSNELAFKVQRATAPGGPFTALVPSANAGQTSYVDANLTPSTPYYYRVVATNSVGDSAAAGLATATTFPLFQPAGLVSYWNFDEGTGGTAFDLTGSGRNGAANGEFNWQPGFQGNAISFHGTGAAISNVVVPDSAPLRFGLGDSFTLAAWVRQGAVHAASEAVIVKSRESGNYYGIYIDTANRWAFRGPGGDVTGPAVTANTWTHVAVVQDGPNGTRKLYINGVQAGLTGAAQAANGPGPLWIGQANTGTGLAQEAFPGEIDEIRLYRRALPSAEIPSLLGPPILQAVSLQTQGAGATFKKILLPSAALAIESRKGSPVGAYRLVLSFSAPVSGLSAALVLQGGGAVVGTAGTPSYDSTGKIVTVPLTGVGNGQALDLRLTGIQPGDGVADIPFKVLWGDVNGDGVVNTVDLNAVQNSRNAALTDANAGYDVNNDGALTAADEVLVANDMQGSGSSGSVPLITSPAEASGTVSSPFNYSILANGATAFDALGLPNGLAVNQASGTISGTPTTQGTSTVALRAVNANGYGSKTLTIDIAPVPTGPPVVNSPSTASGVLMQPFSYTIKATNSPTSFTATGLPSGLNVNPLSGLITGNPSTVGTANVVLTAKNSFGQSASFTLALTVGGGPNSNLALAGTASSYNPDTGAPRTVIGTNTPALAIDNNNTVTRWESEHSDPTALAVDLKQTCTIRYVILNWQNAAGKNYSIQVSPNNTDWTTVGGETANPNGGVRTFTMPANTTARYVRMNGRTRVGGFGYSIFEFQVWGVTGVVTGSAPSITSALGKTGTVGVPFSYQIEATGNPVSYDAPNLPDGLSLTAGGAITGTPTSTAGSPKSVTISATNSYGTDTKTLVITINSGSASAPSITSPLNKTGNVGAALEYQIQSVPAATGYDAAPLPAGLTINKTTGLISGQPNAAGSTNVTLTATNANGSGTATLALTVGAPLAPPVITSAASKAGNVNTALTYQIEATNSPTRFAAANLPAGLGVNPATGAITGSPTASGTFKATIKATNSSGTTSAYVTFVIASGAETNLSLGQFSTGYSFQPGNTYANGNDANPTGTRWAAADDTFPLQGQWWKVDLGGSKVVTKVDIAWFNPTTRAYKYKVEISPDDSAYTMVLDRTTNTVNGHSPGILASSVTGRWLRVTVTGSTTGGFASFWDCSVFGTAAPATPVITSPLNASGVAGEVFSYQMTATPAPTGYFATGLPNGLSLDPASGVISGIPTAAGTASVTLSAKNTGGTGPTSTLSLSVSPAAGAVLTAAASRKAHGAAGTLDRALATGAATTEVRSGPAAGDYSLVLTFSAPVSGLTAQLQLQAGQAGSVVGSAGVPSYGGGNTVVTIPLVGVGNAQRLKLRLTGIQPGNATVEVPFNLLAGDVNGDGTVNALDIGQVKARAGQAVDQATMPYDVNADGVINTADQTATRAWSGAALP